MWLMAAPGGSRIQTPTYYLVVTSFTRNVTVPDMLRHLCDTGTGMVVGNEVGGVGWRWLSQPLTLLVVVVSSVVVNGGGCRGHRRWKWWYPLYSPMLRLGAVATTNAGAGAVATTNARAGGCSDRQCWGWAWLPWSSTLELSRERNNSPHERRYTGPGNRSTSSSWGAGGAGRHGC